MSAQPLVALLTEEHDAWDEYLEACRKAGDRYDAVEAWAWNRLQSRLTAAQARGRAVKPPQ